MASYTIGANFSGGKGVAAAWVYPVSSQTTTGTGHTSSDPLDLDAGDTLTIEIGSSSGPGTAVISGFSIFTDNSNATVGGGNSITRTVASGGTTADTLTITKTTTTGSSASDDFFLERQGPQPPVMDIANHFNQQESTTVTVQVDLTSTGSGGTLKYAAGTSATTPPSTGWQTSNQFTQNRETTKYYWASQDEDTAGQFSTSSKVEVAADPILTSMPAASSATHGMIVNNSAGRLAFSTRRRSLVLQYTNTYTLGAGASTTISNIDGANDKDLVLVFIEGISNYATTGTGNAVKVSGRTSSSITITNSGNQSKSFRVKVVRVT